MRNHIAYAVLVLVVLSPLSPCFADATDDRVSYVQHTLGLTDVNTQYLKQVLLEPVSADWTRLEEAEALAFAKQQSEIIDNYLYYRMVDFWVQYRQEQVLDALKDFVCEVAGFGTLCGAIDFFDQLHSLTDNSHPAIREWSALAEGRLVQSYLVMVVTDPDNDAEDWDLLSSIWMQIPGWDQLDGDDGRTREQVAHDFCRLVWKINERVKSSVLIDLPPFVNYIRSRTVGEAVIAMTVSGQPATSKYAPVTVTFDGSASHGTSDHPLTSLDWTWNGGSASGQTVTRTFSTPGDYSVTLKATADNGWNWSKNVAFKALGPSIVGVQDADNHLRYHFTGNGGPDVDTFTWDFGDGSATAQGASQDYTYASVGTYRVTLTVTTTSGNVSTTRSFRAGVGGPVYVEGTIAADESWVSGCNPYIVTGTVAVNPGAHLTISPGTVIKFEPGAGLVVNGELTAEGHGDDYIWFTTVQDDGTPGDTGGYGDGSDPEPGDWTGIHITGAGASGAFSRCMVSYGGGSWPPANIYADSGHVTIRDCTVTNSLHYGVFCSAATSTVVDNTVSYNGEHGAVFWYAVPSELTGNRFYNNVGVAASISQAGGRLEFSGNSGSGNGLNGLYLKDCTVDASSRWQPTPGFPYVVDSVTINPGKTLTLDPGVVVKLDYYDEMTVNGSLIACGTAALPVCFTSRNDDSIDGDTNGDGGSTAPAGHEWRHIEIGGPGANASFDHCIVRYGGRWEYGADDRLQDASLVAHDGALLGVSNSVVERSFNRGIFCQSILRPKIATSTIQDNAGDGLVIVLCQYPSLNTCVFNRNGIGYSRYPVTVWSSYGDFSFRGNSGRDNCGEGIFLYYCYVTADAHWQSPGEFPMIVGAGVSVESGSTLTVDAGSVVKVGCSDDYHPGWLRVEGGLVALGSVESPIYFTSVRDDSVGGDANGDGDATTGAPGDWGGIIVDGNAASGLFQHCVMTYGGANTNSSAANLTVINGGTVSVVSSTVARSLCDGVDGFDSTLSLSNSIFAHNGRDGVLVYGSAVDATYCDIWPDMYWWSFTPGVGFVSADPRFVSATDYHLLPESPCVDSGDPSILDPDGSRSDIGAFPYTGGRQARVGEIRGRENGLLLRLKGKIVTAAFPERFYVEELDRASGIAVMGAGPGQGDMVSILGRVGVVEGEKCLTDAAVDVLSSGNQPALSLGISNKIVGGGDWNFSASTGAGQQGIANAFGLNNIGLLVTTWGRVTEHEPVPPPQVPTWFIIDDGSGVNLRCALPSGASAPSLNDYVQVTGISSCEKVGDDLHRLLRVRSPADIVTP